MDTGDIDSGDLDRQAAALAEHQHGHVSRAQALALGMTPRMITQRTVNGRWEPVTGRVFRLCGAPRSWQGRLLAAVLDAGDGAVATGRSGAALWRVAGYGMREPEVLVARPGDHRPPIGILHETRHLPPHHVTAQQGVPVVTPARLMVDLAAIERPQRLERAIDNAIAASILTPEALAIAVAELATGAARAPRS